jgi:hypothetical protein
MHVFKRLQEMTGIYVTKEVQAAIEKDFETDIYVDEIMVKVKHLSIVDYAGRSILFVARSAPT